MVYYFCNHVRIRQKPKWRRSRYATPLKSLCSPIHKEAFALSHIQGRSDSRAGGSFRGGRICGQSICRSYKDGDLMLMVQKRYFLWFSQALGPIR